MRNTLGRTRISLLVLAPLVLLAVAAGGCDILRQQVVAKVEKHTLTLKQFETLLGQSAGGPTPPDSVYRRMMVDDWIDRTLLVQEAETMKLDTLAQVNNQLRVQADQVVAEELYRREVVEKAKVTEADIKAIYEKRKSSWQIAHIVCADRAKADEARAAVAKGMSFEEAAAKFSQDPQTGMMGGVVPHAFSYGELPPELEDVLAKLKAGEVGGPVEYQGGFEILKLLEIKPAEVAPYAQLKPELEKMLMQRRNTTLTQALVKAMKTKHKFVIQPSDVKRFVERMRGAPGDTIPAFSQDVLNEPLARFEGGPYTTGDFLRDISRSSMMSRPNLSEDVTVTRFVDNGATYALLIAEARSRKLDREPRVLTQLEQAREQALTRAVVAKVLGSRPHPGEEELRAEYEKRKGDFVNNGSAEFFVISTTVERDAQEASREARAGIPFATLQKRYAKPTAEEARLNGAGRLVFDGRRPALEDSLRGRQPGSVVGPVAFEGRYFVYEVRNTFPPMSQGFEDARMSLMQIVSREWQTRLLREHVDQLKKKWVPTVNVKTMLGAKPAKPAAKAAAGQ
ncbi:MAG: peptidyl-prolyl cis-trans isomerase [Candidatus Eisenbacteria bacterium]|nr:peptidyl-prolyl cis-trans isomerase [Candidatus Eisenbacteria bacterium]